MSGQDENPVAARLVAELERYALRIRRALFPWLTWERFELGGAILVTVAVTGAGILALTSPSPLASPGPPARPAQVASGPSWEALQVIECSTIRTC
jgi:hypothetical protein